MSYLEEYGKIPLPKIREEVIEQLTLNYAHNNLEEEEFERRLEEATGAESKSALLALVADLPTLKDDPSATQEGAAYQLNLGSVKHDDIMVGILSGTERKGPWLPAKYTNLIAFMGGIDLDFTEAKLAPEVMEINLFCLMGGVDIIVPPGINVDVSCVSIMGGTDNHTSEERCPGAPTLRIRGIVLMGGVDIKYPSKKKRRRNHG
ncbi:MAG: DUF1707 domain-containing protein [Spirochaetales bacterium]|nr:DUF1707 domain-containing protein [Spirochaetales bacterium]